MQKLYRDRVVPVIGSLTMKILAIHVACAVVGLELLTAGCANKTQDASVVPPQTATPQTTASQPPATPAPPASQPQTTTSQPAATPVPPASQPQTTASQPSAATPAAPATPPATAAATTPPATTAAAPPPAPAAAPAPGATSPAAKKTTPPASTPAPPARTPQPAQPAAAAAAAPTAPTLDLAALKERLRATKAIGVFTKISLKNQVDDFMKEFSDYYQGKGKLTLNDLRRSYNLLMMKVLSLLQDTDKPLATAIVSSKESLWGMLANPATFATLQS